MNLGITIEVYAGGVGSGCHGPNCGRPAIDKGDRVTLKPGVHVVNPNSGAKTQFKEGTIAVVTNVMPKVGQADQMVGIQSEKDQGNGKYGNMGYVKMDDLNLHQKMADDTLGALPPWSKSWSKPNPQDKKLSFIQLPPSPSDKKNDIQPVPKSQVLMHTTTNDGASLTWVKTPQTGEKEARELSDTEHNLKGKFMLLTGTSVKDPDGQTRTTRVYDTTRTPLESRSVQKGSTVWVSSKTSNGKINSVEVREQNFGQHAQKTSLAQFQYTNSAAAVGLLQSRYGISTSLKKL